MAKFCANCGKELIPGKPFCPDCGYSNNAAPEAPAHHLSASKPQPPQNRALPPNSYAQSPYQPTSRAQQAPAPQPQPQAHNIQQTNNQPKEQPQKTGCLDSPLLTVCNVIFAIIMAIELIVASLWYPGFFIRP
ncbi:MAG: zinc ribbon domain-containing protein [bacterium]|nr:zinc ribbon domain-containing protein [bacterium]